MKRYRYKTAALHGPWREFRTQAEADAMAARLADVDDRGRLVWRVPGEIEMGDRPQRKKK